MRQQGIHREDVQVSILTMEVSVGFKRLGFHEGFSIDSSVLRIKTGPWVLRSQVAIVTFGQNNRGRVTGSICRVFRVNYIIISRFPSPLYNRT